MMNFKNMMAQANKLKSDLTKKMAEFDLKEFEIPYQNNAIKVKLLGSLKIIDIQIINELVDPEDKQTLQEMLAEAINYAQDQINNKKEELTRSLMPKGFGGLF